MPISEDDFVFYKQFLDKSSGYHLYKDKLYFLENRLQEVAKCNRMDNVQDVRRALQREPFGTLAQNVIEAMTVNETFFFRDRTPYEFFEQVLLPEFAERGRGRSLRIWSAACSTGQEPYSLAMILQEKSRCYPHLRWEIVASDINNRILARARSGLFSDLEVNRGLSEAHLQRYFTRDGSQWRIDEGLRRNIQFRQHNLRDLMQAGEPFDFVLLRNVMIYFDRATKARVTGNVRRVMRDNGYLLLGAAEHITDDTHAFDRCGQMRGLYQLRAAQPLQRVSH